LSSLSPPAEVRPRLPLGVGVKRGDAALLLLLLREEEELGSIGGGRAEEKEEEEAFAADTKDRLRGA
jgi:hypothetical protein